MRLLPKRLVEKPWGKDCLPAPFETPQGNRIGEIWFEPPLEVPGILVKYIFTTEKLSVQVHPSDAQAKALGERDRGKEECWLVLDAEPDAKLGIGLRQPVDAEQMRRAALDGSIEDLMVWHPVRRGDFFYIPAGTVHAIGAGITLVEIQQNSDITYRLYDYGRPRELHLDKGVAVVDFTQCGDPRRHVALEHFRGNLVSSAFFSADMIEAGPQGKVAPADEDSLIVVLAGELEAAGLQATAGDCVVVSPGDEIVGRRAFCAVRVSQSC